MPKVNVRRAYRRKKYARKSVARSRKRRANVRVQKTNVILGDGLPKRIMVRQHYIGSYKFTSTTGVPAVYKFATNGLYDPDVSGGGHQPYYFDQLAALYNHYTVIGSKITVTITPDTASTLGVVAGVYINDDTTTTPVSLTDFLETNQSRWKMTVPQQGKSTVFINKWSAKKTFGGSVLANDDLKGTSSSNPAETSVFNFFLSAADTASTVAVDAIVRIDYIVEWSELKDIASS